MPRRCTVIVPLSPLEGCFDAVVGILDEVLADIRQGEGCLRYDVKEEVSGRLVLIEEWESRDHWLAHFDWEPIQRLKRELADKVIVPVERWEMYDREDPDNPAERHLIPESGETGE
jgi:quinol monooxygenase YgiN